MNRKAGDDKGRRRSKENRRPFLGAGGVARNPGQRVGLSRLEASSSVLLLDNKTRFNFLNPPALCMVESFFQNSCNAQMDCRPRMTG